MKRIFHKQHGDTIVEVLVSVAALSLVLSASYALANRSTQATRQAQERGESFKTAESQLERFKEYITTPSPGNPEPADGDIFCVKPDGTLDKFTGAPPEPDPQDELITQFAAFNSHPDCVSGFYHSYIQRTGSTYTVHTRWNAATGRGIDEATMVYRVYPDDIALDLGGAIVPGGCAADFFLNSVNGCVPCISFFPQNYSTVAGSYYECYPDPATIIVAVKKVDPSPGNITPPCSSGSLTDRSGATVTLSSGATATTSGTPSTASFSSGLSFGTTYTATAAPPGGTVPGGADFTVNGGTDKSGQDAFLPCPGTASATVPALPAGPPYIPPGGPPGGAGSTTNSSPTLKFIPNCYVRNDSYPQLVDDPATYHSGDVTAWGPGYYTLGSRRSDLDYYAPTGYSGTYQNYPISPSFGYSAGHPHPGTPSWSGVAYHASWGVSHHSGYSGYNIWEANGPYYDPIAWGPPHYHGQMWITVPFYTNHCPS